MKLTLQLRVVLNNGTGRDETGRDLFYQKKPKYLSCKLQKSCKVVQNIDERDMCFALF